MFYVYVGFILFLVGQVYLYSPVATSASFDAEVEANTLNVRAGPGMRYDILDKLPKGARVEILEDEVLERGRNTNENWTKIYVTIDGNRVVGWVCDRFLAHYDYAEPQVASVEFELPEVQESGDRPVIVAPETPVSAGPRPVIAMPEPAVVAPEPAPSPETFDGEVFFAISGLEAPDLSEKQLPFLNEPADTILAMVAPPAVGKPGVAPEWAPDAAMTTPPAPPEKEALTFEALGIDCRRSYFGSSFEACVTRIALDVSLPAEMADYAKPTIPVECEVEYRLVADGKPRVTMVLAEFDVPLSGGTGAMTAEVPLVMESRLTNVTRATAGAVTCRPAWQ